VQASSDGFNLIDIPGTVYGITFCCLPDLAEALEFKGLKFAAAESNKDFGNELIHQVQYWQV
jgi:hypothetical protein